MRFLDIIIMLSLLGSWTYFLSVGFLDIIMMSSLFRHNCSADLLVWWLVIVVTVGRFYIALFTAVEQTCCDLVTCDSEWVTVDIHSAFWISTEVVYLQRCLVVTWLVPHKTAAFSAHVRFCVHCTTMHQFTASLHAKPLRLGAVSYTHLTLPTNIAV